MPSLRSQAVAAYQAQENDRAAEARAALGSVLTPASVTALTVEHSEVTSAYTLFVFTDGDLHLGVRKRNGTWTVHIVDNRDGWTDLAEVTSLAHLGKLLPDYDPIDENAAPAVPAWTTGVAYKVDDQVTYGGFTWKCLQGHTSQAGWEPPNVASLWTKVAS